MDAFLFGMDSDIRDELLSDFDDALDRVIKNAVKIMDGGGSDEDSVKRISRIMRYKENLKKKLNKKWEEDLGIFFVPQSQRSSSFQRMSLHRWLNL